MFRIAPKRLDDRIDVSSAKIDPSEWVGLDAVATYKPIPEIEFVPELGVTTGHLDVYRTRLRSARARPPDAQLIRTDKEANQGRHQVLHCQRVFNQIVIKDTLSEVAPWLNTY